MIRKFSRNVPKLLQIVATTLKGKSESCFDDILQQHRHLRSEKTKKLNKSSKSFQYFIAYMLTREEYILMDLKTERESPAEYGAITSIVLN